MTLYAVLIPKWGLAMEEATLTTWLVPAGAAVLQGQPLAELETTKIANTIEAPAAGVVRRVAAHPGEVLPVGALLAVLSDAAEPEAQIDDFVAGVGTQPSREDGKTAPQAPLAETVLVGGDPVRFLKLSAPGGASGPPAILLHGFGGDHVTWTLNQQAIAGARDTYAIDLPGHGGSSKDVGDGSLETLAARVAAWLDVLGLDRVHLVGHSMGAAIAASLALAAPDRVISLVAVCGAGFGNALNRAYIDGFVAAARRKDLQPLIGQLFADPSMVTREMLDELAAYKRLDGVAQALRLIGTHALAEPSLARLNDRLQALPVPMLAVWGSEDRIVSAGSAPGEEFIVAGAGHMPHMEAASVVNTRIVAYLRANDRKKGLLF